MPKVQRFIKKIIKKIKTKGKTRHCRGGREREKKAEINNTFTILGQKKMGTGLKVLGNCLGKAVGIDLSILPEAPTSELSFLEEAHCHFTHINI